jgi:hypothetical protein
VTAGAALARATFAADIPLRVDALTSLTGPAHARSSASTATTWDSAQRPCRVSRGSSASCATSNPHRRLVGSVRSADTRISRTSPVSSASSSGTTLTAYAAELHRCPIISTRRRAPTICLPADVRSGGDVGFIQDDGLRRR